MQIGSVVWEEFYHIHTYIHRYTHTYTRNWSEYTQVLITLERHLQAGLKIKSIPSRVVMVAGICNSVSGGVFLTCHRGASGEYGLVSRLGLLVGNRWMLRFGCPGMH